MLPPVILTEFLVLGTVTTVVCAFSFLGFFTFLPCLFMPLAMSHSPGAIRLAALSLRLLQG